jgi:hypothetical protein
MRDPSGLQPGSEAGSPLIGRRKALPPFTDWT